MAEKMNEKENGTLTVEKNRQEPDIATVPMNPQVNAGGLVGIDEDSSEATESVSANRESVAVYQTPLFMFRKPRIGKDGKTYYNYYAGVMGSRNGMTKEHRVNFKLSDEYAEAYSGLDYIFGDEKKMPLSIVRTEMVNSKTRMRSITYVGQVSCLEDDGTTYAIRMSPINANDRIEFETVLSKLRTAGYII